HMTLRRLGLGCIAAALAASTAIFTGAVVTAGPAAANPPLPAKGLLKITSQKHAELSLSVEGASFKQMKVRQLGKVGEFAAGRKCPTAAGEHCRARGAVLAQPWPQLCESDVQVVVDRVEGIRPVQGDDPQCPFATNVDFGWHVVHVRVPVPRFAQR